MGYCCIPNVPVECEALNDIKRLEGRVKDLEKRNALLVSKLEAMRNCTNCIHKGVCVTVHNRKVLKANDYRPCDEWVML